MVGAGIPCSKVTGESSSQTSSQRSRSIKDCRVVLPPLDKERLDLFAAQGIEQGIDVGKGLEPRRERALIDFAQHAFHGRCARPPADVELREVEFESATPHQNGTMCGAQIMNAQQTSGIAQLSRSADGLFVLVEFAFAVDEPVGRCGPFQGDERTSQHLLTEKLAI